MKSRYAPQSTPIAVIGLGCWYPGADSPAQLWKNILARRVQFRRIPDQRLPLKDYQNSDRTLPDLTYGTEAALIDGFDFPWQSYRIPKRTYESTDLAQWLALEVSLRTIRDAGYEPGDLPRDSTGVILGNTLTGEFTRSHLLRLRWPYVRKTLLAAAAGTGLEGPEAAALADSMEGYFKAAFPEENEDSLAGGLSNTIAGRIANFNDFHGCGYVVDGACSSSLIAVAQAATALESGDLDVALAGGVDISLDPFELVGFAKAGALTPGRMRVYDRRGSGFIPGEGAGFVMLKRLEDAKRDGNYVYAVLHGWGLSSDGKGGITAPSDSGQARALERAYAKAPYLIEEVDFFEGHGTGTTVGDRIELKGVALALGLGQGEAGTSRFGMTSFKSICGHTKAAAGIGGFLKTVMAVNQRVLPPLAGCEELNPVFDAEARGLYPLRYGRVLDPGLELRAGVSAMGFGGSNSHATLCSAGPRSPGLEPDEGEDILLSSYQTCEAFPFAAAEAGELAGLLRSFGEEAAGISHAEMADLSARSWRELEADRPWRAAVLAETPAALAEALGFLRERLEGEPLPEGGFYESKRKDLFISHAPARPTLAFLYPGQGSQAPNIAAWLFGRFAWARDLLDKTAALVGRETGDPRKAELFRVLVLPRDGAANAAEVDDTRRRLADTLFAQPAIVLQELVLTKFLASLGIRPDAVGGQSLGELTALHAAGAFGEEELLELAVRRGRTMAAEAGGTMASLACDRRRAEELIARAKGYAIAANYNAPDQTVISGDEDAVGAVLALAAEAGIVGTPLPVSAAFHSKYMETAAKSFEAAAGKLRPFTEAGVAFYSGVTGGRLEGLARPLEHLARQITAPVDFLGLVGALAPAGAPFLGLEVGPRAILSGLAPRIRSDLEVLPLESSAGSWSDLCRVLCRLHVAGMTVDGAALFANRYVLPFVDPRERLFIRNPCERPLPVLPAGEGARPAVSMRGLPGIDSTVLADYVRRRGSFLARVIRADLEEGGEGALPRLPAAEPGRLAPPPGPAPAPALAADRSPETVLLRLAASTTGFEVASLSLENRLLDDLNLDSIKSAQFVNEAAKVLNLQGRIEPSSVANARLREIAALFREHLKDLPAEISEPRKASGDIGELLALVERKTGFPPEGLAPSFRLLDDLNLDSIKAADFLREAARIYDYRGELDTAALANASLESIHSTLYGRRQSEEKVLAPEVEAETRVQPTVAGPTWVRSFVTRWVPEALVRPEGQDPTETSFALVAESAGELARFWEELASRGLRARTVSLSGVGEEKEPEEGVFVCILPPTSGGAKAGAGSESTAPSRASLRREVEILRKAALLASTLAASRRPASLVFLRETGSAGTGPRELAFLESLHLEHPRLRMRYLKVERGIAPSTLVDLVLAEIGAHSQFQIGSYDAAGRRSVPYQFLSEIDEKPNAAVASLGTEDVLLVTGGGKGITAACLLAAGLPAFHAILGRSPASDPEIGETMKALADRGLAAAYYRADVTDPADLRLVLETIAKERGRITGIVHGAALNVPRRAEAPDTEQVLAEIAPKVLGLLNLLEACDQGALKLLAVFSSIIGVVGMMGNAWYAYSNEVLVGILGDFRARFPKAHSLALAYSVWGRIGMGARLGSVEALSKQGIEAVPPEEGAGIFRRAVRGRPEALETVVTGRAYGLDTWRRVIPAARRPLRFAELIDRFEPGVELVTRTTLSHRDDPYLIDHNYKGSFLFPTVFGIEAMAQNACLLFDLDPALIRSVRIEGLELRLPIPVPEDGGTEIRITSLALGGKGELRAHSGIACEITGFGRFHFEGDFTFSLRGLKSGKPAPAAGGKRLDIVPREDLYGTVLFQGERFRLLEGIHRWDRSSIVYSLRGEAAGDWGTVLGSPFSRDVLLQSAQLFVPGRSCLPIHVARWDIDLGQEAGLRLARTTSREAGADERRLAVAFWDAAGTQREVLEGYRVKYLEKSGQSLAEYLQPDEWDGGRVMEALRQALGLHFPGAGAGGAGAFTLRLHHAAGAHSRDAAARHTIETELVRRAFPREVLEWSPEGGPRLTRSPGQSVSISHDDGLFLAFAPKAEAAGCDVLPRGGRTRAEWEELLPALLRPLLSSFTDPGEGGHYLWAAMEALRKASGSVEEDFRLVALRNGIARFSAGDFVALAFPLRLSRGGVRIFAFALPSRGLETRQAAREVETTAPLAQGLLLLGRGAAGEALFAHRFGLTFRENAALGRGIHFSNFFSWIGRVRELMLEPVSRRLAEQFSGGEWGMVTNSSSTSIYGDAFHYEPIECRFRILRIHGSKSSTIDMEFVWHKVGPGGRLVPIATSRQETTWFKTVSRGVVEPWPFPDYFRDFLDGIAPAAPCADSAPTPEPAIGRRLRSWTEGPKVRFVHAEEFSTSLANANLVGNNYFANYFVWEGHVADRFLWSLRPELFSTHGEGGEFLCLLSTIEHLRESMPFDTVVARLAILSLHEMGIEFRVDFFRRGEGGTEHKIAVGAITLGWGRRSAAGAFDLEALPPDLAAKLEEAGEKGA